MASARKHYYAGWIIVVFGVPCYGNCQKALQAGEDSRGFRFQPQDNIDYEEFSNRRLHVYSSCTRCRNCGQSNSKWMAPNTCQGDIKFGLWERCTLFASNGSNDTTAKTATSEVKCESYDPKPAWLKATIAMTIIGSIGLLADTVSVLLSLLPRNIVKTACDETGCYSIFGGICMFIGVIVWAAKYKDEHELAACEYSVGFYMAIISGSLAFIGGSIVDPSPRISKSSAETEPV